MVISIKLWNNGLNRWCLASYGLWVWPTLGTFNTGPLLLPVLCSGPLNSLKHTPPPAPRQIHPGFDLL